MADLKNMHKTISAGQKANVQIRDKTTCTRINTRLNPGEDYFRKIFDNAAVGMMIADANLNYLAVNDRYCEITGYSREKLLSISCGQIVYPDDQAMAVAEIGRLVSGESKSFSCDLRHIHANGSTVWVRVQVSVFAGKPGKGVHIIAVVEDITKRKRIEEEFHNAELSLRSVLDSSRDVIYRINLQNGQYEYISPSCESVVGHSLDTIMTQGTEAIKSLIHPDDLPGLKEKLARLEASGKEEAEGRFIKNGEYRWLSNRMFLIRDSSGRPLYRDGTIRDITERKRAEANLAFLANVQDDLANSKSVDDIMKSVGAKIGAFLDVAFCFFAEIDEEVYKGQLKYIWHAEDVPRLPEAIRLSDFVHTEFYRVLQKGESIIIRDTETDPRNNPEPFRAISMRAYIAVPFSRYTEWKILLIIADKNPRNWRDDELDLIREVSHRVFPRLENARAENALKDSEERFRMFMDNSPANAWIKDEQGRYVYLSKTYEKRLGVRLEDWLGKTDFEIWPREVAEQFRKNDLAVLGAGRAMEMTEVLVDADGNRHYWWNFKFPLKHPSGSRYVAGIGVDITESKKSEKALRESEERFRSAFEKGAVPMAMTGPDKRIIAVNAAFKDLLGYSDAEIANMSIFDITHPEDIGKNKPGIDAIMRGEKDSFRMEKRYITKDGRTVWADMSTSSVRDETGKMLYLITYAQDITERKQAEEELRHQRELLNRFSSEIQKLDSE